MIKLKPISKESIPVALDKAERYRLLGEPLLAESICLDILEADPQNKKAIIFLILAITDQFHTGYGDPGRAKHLLARLTDEYEKHYYAGLISERDGKSTLQKRKSYSSTAYDLLRDAMDHYEKAEAIRPQGNDDAILRWNTCARLITSEQLEPSREQRYEPELE